jgi:ribosomal protein L7/L12
VRTVGKTIDRDRLLADARELLDDEHDIEQVLRFLRAAGFGMIDSIKATMALTGVPLGEAKRLVHTSAAWADRRAEHDALHRAVAEAVENESGRDADPELSTDGSVRR